MDLSLHSSRILFSGAVLACLFVLVEPCYAEYRSVTDDLGDYLVNNIVIPGEEDSFVPPSAAEQEAFYSAVQELLRLDFTGAAADIDPLGYDLIEFHDTITGQTYHVMEERLTARGLGTYAFNSGASRLLNIQVPHPIVDGGTWAESVEIFLQVEALFFQIAGTHRCAHPTASTCDGNTALCGGVYRISDVAHYTENFFQAASNAVHDEIPLLVSISIHGYGCATEDLYETSSLAQISNGTSIDVLGSLATRLAMEYNAILSSPAIAYLFLGAGSFNVHPTEPAGLQAVACNLMSGGTNVQGRYINGETANPCGTAVTSPVLHERFLHIEQQPALRSDVPDGNGISWQVTIDAIRNLFEPAIWVDFANTGAQLGSWSYPYASLGSAVDQATIGQTIIIKTGQGFETLIIDKPVLIRSSGGSAIIGTIAKTS